MTTDALPFRPGLRRVYRRLERWRLTHRRAPRSPIPESVWAAARGAGAGARFFHAAKVLRWNYGKLKRLVESAGPMERGRVTKARPRAILHASLE